MAVIEASATNNKTVRARIFSELMNFSNLDSQRLWSFIEAWGEISDKRTANFL